MPLFLTRECTSRVLEACLSRPRGAGQGASGCTMVLLCGPRTWASETLVLLAQHLEFLEFL